MFTASQINVCVRAYSDTDRPTWTTVDASAVVGEGGLRMMRAIKIGIPAPRLTSFYGMLVKRNNG